jgi:hypothetical protein
MESDVIQNEYEKPDIGSPKFSPPFKLTGYGYVSFPSPLHATFPAHLILLDLKIQIILGG